MKLSEAIKLGIPRLRLAHWPEKVYIKLDMMPWVDLFSRQIQKLVGEPTPQHVIWPMDTLDDYAPYTGQLDNADKSKAEIMVDTLCTNIV